MAENYQSPYDTGRRCEPHPWPLLGATLDQDTAPLERTMIENRYDRVDFDDENGDSLFTVWVERNDAGHHVVHIQQLGPTPVALHIHGEGDHG